MNSTDWLEISDLNFCYLKRRKTFASAQWVFQYWFFCAFKRISGWDSSFLLVKTYAFDSFQWFSIYAFWLSDFWKGLIDELTLFELIERLSMSILGCLYSASDFKSCFLRKRFGLMLIGFTLGIEGLIFLIDDCCFMLRLLEWWGWLIFFTGFHKVYVKYIRQFDIMSSMWK